MNLIFKETHFNFKNRWQYKRWTALIYTFLTYFFFSVVICSDKTDVINTLNILKYFCFAQRLCYICFRFILRNGFNNISNDHFLPIECAVEMRFNTTRSLFLIGYKHQFFFLFTNTISVWLIVLCFVNLHKNYRFVMQMSSLTTFNGLKLTDLIG